MHEGQSVGRRLTRGPALVAAVAAACGAMAGTASAAQAPPASEVAAYAREHGVSSAVAAERLEVTRRGWNIVAEAKAILGDAYAGVWFDNDTGRFRIGRVAGTPVAAAEKVAAAADVTADADVVDVRSTWDELVAAQAEIDRDVAREGVAASVSTGVDTARNAVLVDVDDGAGASARADVADAVAGVDDTGVRVVRTSVESATTAPAACSFPNCDTPFHGGQAISAPGGNCTAGFTTSWGGSPYVVTAGHCAGYYSPWIAGSSAGVPYSLGPSGGAGSWYVGGGLGDAGMINASGTVWAGSWSSLVAAWGNAPAIDYPIHGRGWSYMGMPLCHEGRTSVQQCGSVTALNVTVPYGGSSPVAGVVVSGMTQTSACGSPGDSGGPVISYNYAYGIFDASNGCPGNSGYYDELLRAEQVIGFTTLTG